MQHSLTTATPFKSQKILFKARALGSNLIHRRLSTSQLPILDPLSPVTGFTSFLSCPPTTYGLPHGPSFARFCDTRISSVNWIYFRQIVPWNEALRGKYHEDKKWLNLPPFCNIVYDLYWSSWSTEAQSGIEFRCTQMNSENNSKLEHSNAYLYK